MGNLYVYTYIYIYIYIGDLGGDLGGLVVINWSGRETASKFIMTIIVILLMEKIRLTS